MARASAALLVVVLGVSALPGVVRAPVAAAQQAPEPAAVLVARAISVVAPGASSGPGCLSLLCVSADSAELVISVPPPAVVEASGPDGAVVEWTVEATDLDPVQPLATTCTPHSGSVFDFLTINGNDRPQPVHCTTSDTDGNTAAGFFSITVVDTTPPELAGLDDVAVAGAAGNGGVVVDYALPTAADLVDGNRDVSCSPASGTTFTAGDTTVTCTSSDTRGNQASGQFLVTAVEDTNAPVLDLPADLTVEATGQGGVAVDYAASATDDVDGPIDPTCQPSSGELFAVGETTVTCTASDVSGNVAEGSFVVVVADVHAPVLVLPDDIVVEATGPDGAAVAAGEVTATDDVDDDVAIECTPVPATLGAGESFEVTCTATDDSGNEAVGSYLISVVDTTPPVLVAPADRTVEGNTTLGADVEFEEVLGVDVVDGTVPATCAAQGPPGNFLPLGATTIRCTAVDAAGNTATTSYVIRVVDTTPPSLPGRADQTLQGSVLGGAEVSIEPILGNDVVGGTVAAPCIPGGEAHKVHLDRWFLPLGENTVTCSAGDGRWNTTTVSYLITVVDTRAPTLSLVDGRTIEANTLGGAAVGGLVRASDVVDGVVPVTCDPPELIPLGIVSVDCQAIDASGNTAADTFTIEVVDTTPPVLIAPADRTVEGNRRGGADVVLDDLFGADLVDGTVPAACTPDDPEPTLGGFFLPLGEHTITCTAADSAGNVAAVDYLVAVVDTTPPPLVMSQPPEVTIEGNVPGGAEHALSLFLVRDVVWGLVPGQCVPGGDAESLGSGVHFLPLGDIPFTCTAADGSGNQASLDLVVTVVDTTPPVLDLPDDREVEGNVLGGAAVFDVLTATDVVDPDVAVTCERPVVFPLGTTTVACQATDGSGNTATGSFDITVVDTSPPLRGVTVQTFLEATGPDGAPFSYAFPVAIDLVFGAVPATCAPASGAMHPLGRTQVRCEASDPEGNTATWAQFVVDVVDTRPPVLSVPDVIAVAPTGADGAPVEAVEIEASATDLVSLDVPVTCDVPDDGFYPFGDTVVTCSAVDEAGNVGTGDVVVRVEGFYRVGFHRPVEMGSPDAAVVNTVTGGSTVPLKFEVFGAAGVEMTSTDVVAGIFPVETSCQTGAREDALEVLASGGTGLHYDTDDGQFVFNFQTPRQRGTCWEVSVELVDGTAITAQFKLR